MVPLYSSARKDFVKKNRQLDKNDSHGFHSNKPRIREIARQLEYENETMV
jgi:hypothetical protein